MRKVCKRFLAVNDATGHVTRDAGTDDGDAAIGHPPEAVFDGNGKKRTKSMAEEEAEWLGPALLVSEEAALLIARSRRSVDEAAEEYGVSVALMQMRLNVTGAIRRAKNRRK